MIPFLLAAAILGVDWKPGDIAHVYVPSPIKGRVGSPATVNMAAYLDMVDATNAGDTDGLMELDRAGLIVWIPDKTVVLVLKVHPEIDGPAIEARVRSDGKYKSQRLWFIEETLRPPEN